MITRSGPDPIPPGQPLPADIDREHYVEKVLRPVADSILTHVGLSFDEVVGGASQLSLL